MTPVEQLKRVLLALPEADLRVGWLSERLDIWPLERSATLLDGLCEESERSNPEAREALLAAVMLFVARGECELVWRLREEAAGRHLLGLGRLLRPGPPSSVLDRPPTDLPVPDYGTGRELTLGERRSLARRPNRRAFDKLLSDPHPLVIRQLLVNPRLTEDDVIRLVTRRPARIDVLREVAKHTRWLARRRVRLSIVLNPGSPPEIAIPLLSVCTRTDLIDAIKSTETSMVLRGTAVELLEHRPPIKGPDLADAVLQ